MSQKINSVIASRRKELGLTLEEVAQAVGVNKGTVSRWERGEIYNMRRDRIASLAKILQLSPLVIMEFTTEDKEAPALAPKHDDFTDLSKIAELTEREHNHITQYRELSDTRKDDVDKYTDDQLRLQQLDTAQTSKALSEIVKKDYDLSSAV